MAGSKRLSYPTFMRLVFAALCSPLLILLLIWWLLKNHWGIGTRKLASVQVLSSMEFENLFKEASPKLLTGTVTQWPAFKKWTPEYLAANVGEEKVEVFVTSGDVTSAFLTRDYTLLQFKELIDIIFLRAPSEKLYYLWGKGLGLLKHLRNDVSVPVLVDGRPLDEVGTGLWVGHKGNFTSLHYDGWHGCIALLWGKKRVSLFSPDDTCNLYQNSPFSPQPYMTKMPCNSMHADEAQFPRAQRAQRMELIMEPGQLLYIPPYWWHEVESLENSISFHIRFLPRRLERVALLLASGNLFSMSWHMHVLRPLQRLLGY